MCEAVKQSYASPILSMSGSFIVDAAPRVQKEAGSKKELHYTEVVETEMVPQQYPPYTPHEKDKQRE